VRIPSKLRAALSSHWGDAGQQWLEAFPERLKAAEVRWGITIGDPFDPGGFTSWTAPTVTQAGEDVVYKCVIPHDEAVGEDAALAAYDGDGAVRLVASQPSTFELLIESCNPGTDLWSATDERHRFEVAGELMRTLWRPTDTGSVASLTDVGPRWADIMERRMLTLDLPWITDPIDRGAELMRTLPFDNDHPLLIHGDFHPGNILAAQRNPWLVIDPKPMIGSPAYDAVQLLTQADGRVVEPPPVAAIEKRLDVLAALLGIEAERIALWALARTAEWSMWSLDHDAIIESAIEYSWARSLDSILAD